MEWIVCKIHVHQTDPSIHPWAYAAFGTGGGVEILYKVTLRHADYAIRPMERAGGGGGGGVLSAGLPKVRPGSGL